MSKTFNTNLVGMQFRPQEARDMVADLSLGDDLQLEREPDNQYDEDAIKVLLNGEHVGYVDSKSGDAGEIAPYLDDNWNYRCYLANMVNPKRPGIHIDLTEPAGDDELEDE